MEDLTLSEQDKITARVFRANRGDRDAREWVAERAYTAGLRLATFSLGDPNLAQDVGQEVAIRVLRGLPKLREPGRFDAWTYRICAGEIKRAAKRRQRHDWRPYDAVEHELRVEASFPQSLGERDWLIQALARLSDRQRLVLGLHYVYGLNDKEIATAIRARRGTVRSLLSRALAGLRAQAMTEEQSHGREAAVGQTTKEEAVR